MAAGSGDVVALLSRVCAGVTRVPGTLCAVDVPVAAPQISLLEIGDGPVVKVNPVPSCNEPINAKNGGGSNESVHTIPCTLVFRMHLNVVIVEYKMDHFASSDLSKPN